MRYFIFILLLVLSLGALHTTNAQLNTFETQIDLEMVPENPGPNEIVQASINSYMTNLNAANIIWKVNGKVTESGVGKKVVRFTTGDMGIKTTLEYTIQTNDGEIIHKTFTISPATVDLIWQSKSFVPPFYKGKALYSHENEVTVIAIPHMTESRLETPPKNLIYTWKKDGKVMESASGYGQNEYTFQGSLISRQVKIEVVVSSPSSEITAYAYVYINPLEPDVVLYKKDPLYGIEFQNALTGTFSIDNINEISVIAMPYFFGTRDMKAPELTYKWAINGAPTNNLPDATTQVFRKKEGTTGSSNISLSVEDSDKVLQYASNNFNLLFGNTTQNQSL